MNPEWQNADRILRGSVPTVKQAKMYKTGTGSGTISGSQSFFSPLAYTIPVQHTVQTYLVQFLL
jgi:hypothetical protein